MSNGQGQAQEQAPVWWPTGQCQCRMDRATSRSKFHLAANQTLSQPNTHALPPILCTWIMPRLRIRNGGARYSMTMIALRASKWCTLGVCAGQWRYSSRRHSASMRARSCGRWGGGCNRDGACVKVLGTPPPRGRGPAEGVAEDAVSASILAHGGCGGRRCGTALAAPWGHNGPGLRKQDRRGLRRRNHAEPTGASCSESRLRQPPAVSERDNTALRNRCIKTHGDNSPATLTAQNSGRAGEIVVRGSKCGGPAQSA
eukprot:364403-Chlamydomonas_euryale.AAC.4